jgi:hypothetical protein
MTAPAAAPIAASRFVFFWVYVPPELVGAVEPDDVDPPELPDELVRRVEVVPVRRVVVRDGDELDVAGAGATRAGACACSSVEIESSCGLGETERALSTGLVSVLVQAAVTDASTMAAAIITFFIALPCVEVW